MKRAWFILWVCCNVWTAGCSESSEEKPVVAEKGEVTLFDHTRKAVAYIDYRDDERPIYLWDGRPVAYLDEDDEVYRYNGSFLGWFTDGILFDEKGDAVAAEKGANRGSVVMSITPVEPIKSIKHIKPISHVQSFPPIKPIFHYRWSTVRTSLDKYLLQEIALFGREKEAVAYIDYADGDERPVYLWDGTPVAYLDDKGECLYRFDGQFVGWYADGIVYDLNGCAIVAEKGVRKGEISMVSPRLEPVKGIKKRKPKQAVKADRPEKPVLQNVWSETSPTDFFPVE